MVGGYITAGIASTGLIITLVAMIYVTREIEHFNRGDWDPIDIDELTLALTPVIFTAGALGVGPSITAMGYGMQRQADAVRRASALPPDQVCIPSWKVDYLKGRRMVALGTVAALAGAAELAFGIVMEATILESGGLPDSDFVFPRSSVVPIILGAVTLVWALPMIVAGALKKKRALMMRDDTSPPGPRIFYTLSPSGLALYW